jgi:ABC-2 type transport system permease protein
VNAANYPRMTTGRLTAAYLGDMRFEFIKMLRTPAFAVPTLLFPAMFYLLFGVLMSGHADPATNLSTFVRLGVFGTMAPGLFGFGVSLAFEREYGLLRFKQALPVPAGSYLLARMAMAMLFACIIALLLLTIAFTLAHAPLSVGQAAKVFVIEVLGVLPFCALGLCVGAFVSGQAAPAIVNLIYLPMAFLSGLWVPLQFLPKMIQQTAPLWPANHLAQLAQGALGLPMTGSTTSHILALAGITILFFFIAVRRLSNGGLRLMGGTQTGGVSVLQRVTRFAVPGIAIMFIIAGVMSSQKTVQAATPADGVSSSATAATSPAGVGAPADGLIADFESGTPKAVYGLGFDAANDSVMGGASTAAIKVVDGGAPGSKRALEVTGTVHPGFAYPFAGAAFFPQQPAFTGMMDYSKFKTLSFYVRGDGKHYSASFFSTADRNTPPSPFPFEAGPEWKEVRVPLADFVVDPSRVRGIMFLYGTPDDPFRFEIDNVRFL